MSLTIADVIEKLKIPGTRFSGADWREGWPDRFYVNNEIVFNSDLKKVSPEEVAAYSEVTKKFFGVTFERVPDGRVIWKCPYVWGEDGYKRAGTVGPEGQVIREDTWSSDFYVN
jgi:hypothetical protein